MQKALLIESLHREVEIWSAKPYEALLTELRDVIAYSAGEGRECYQIEVDRLECTPEYIHVAVSIDDGGWRAFMPLSTSFLVYRDGRVDKPGEDEIHSHLPVAQVVIKRAVAVWLVLMAVEFIHGVLRSLLLVPVVGDFRSRQIGVFTGSILILIVAYVFVRWLQAPNTRTLLQVGVLWVVLTVAFEFSFGHFVLGRAWLDLVSDYNILHGGFLAIGMVVLMLSPVIMARLRRQRH